MGYRLVLAAVYRQDRVVAFQWVLVADCLRGRAAGYQRALAAGYQRALAAACLPDPEVAYRLARAVGFQQVLAVAYRPAQPADVINSSNSA